MADRNNDLWSFELSEQEWRIAVQLCDILKICDVSNPQITYSSFLNCCMFRSWKMQLCSSHIPLPVWLQLSLLWISLMTNLLHMHMIGPYPQPSKHLLNSERKHWTSTTCSQTHQRSTKSLWVCNLMFYWTNLLIPNWCSPASLSQTFIFYNSWLGSRMDWNGKGTGTWCVWAILQAARCSRGRRPGPSSCSIKQGVNLVFPMHSQCDWHP